MKIFITGIYGFIAGHLRAVLQDKGYEVCGSTSRNLEPTGRPSPIEKIHHHKLGDRLDSSMFEGMDVLIHCAHDFQKGALNRNIEGTIALAEAAQKHRVNKQIFISSLSSRPEAQTEYGKAKFEIEKYFKRNKGIIIRPGTVLGPGGIFEKIVRIVRSFPIVPLPGGGHSQMYLIGIDDLCRSIDQILNSAGKTIEYNLYDPKSVTLKEIVMAIRMLLERKTIFIPVPATLLIFPLSFLGWFGINLPVNIDNLRGFMISQTMAYESDLHKVLESPMAIEDILAAYFKAKR